MRMRPRNEGVLSQFLFYTRGMFLNYAKICTIRKCPTIRYITIEGRYPKLGILLMYTISEVKVFSRFYTLKARGCVNREDTKPSDITDF